MVIKELENVNDYISYSNLKELDLLIEFIRKNKNYLFFCKNIDEFTFNLYLETIEKFSREEGCVSLFDGRLNDYSTGRDSIYNKINIRDVIAKLN